MNKDGARWLDLWTFGLSAETPADDLNLWTSVMSHAEREKAARFRQPERRVQAIASRALLRHALSERAKVSAKNWNIDIDTNERPHLVPRRSDLEFNISHTDGMVACAVSAGFAVGVDVEHRARASEMADVERHFLSAHERSEWQSKSGTDAETFLVQLWTLKEAWAKAVGLGLQIDFSTVSFTFDNAQEIRMLRDPEWRLCCRVLATGHVVSVAWKSPDDVRFKMRDGSLLLDASRGVRTVR